MTTYNQDLLIAAHNQSIRHREDIVNSENCGCFYCLTIFKPIQILEWIDDDQTALCPNCDIDAVIGVKSGFPVTDLDFLEQMHRYFFQCEKISIEQAEIITKKGRLRSNALRTESFWEHNGSKDLTDFLSGGEYWERTEIPADSAFWEYWKEAIEKVRSEGPIYKVLTKK